jgi:copper transport protein
MTDPRAPGRPRRWPQRVLASLALTTAGLLAGAGSASAHAVLISTTPARNTILTAPPGQVTLRFGESVLLPPSALRVFDPAGVQVDDGHPVHPGPDGATVGVGLRAGTAQGSYTVAWRVISADTHPVSGAFNFSVGHPSATSAAIAAPPGGSLIVGMLYAVVRALAYASFAALAGAAAFMLWCWPAGAARPLAPRVAATGWATLLLSTIATLLLQGPYGDGTGLADIVEPGTVATTLALPLGGALIARLLLLAATAVYLGQLRHRLPTATSATLRGLRISGVLLAVGIAATWSISGHAAVGRQPELALPVDLAHLLAMATWLGGLAVLAAALRHTPSDLGHRQQLTAAVTRFSPIALGCVAVLGATGTYQSWRQVGSWPALTGTDYGRLLILKVLAVLALLTVAAGSRRAVHRMRAGATAHRAAVPAGAATPRGPWPPATSTPTSSPPPAQSQHADTPEHRLRLTVLIETIIAVAVLALTAVLVNAEPARTAAAAAASDTRGPVRASLAYNTGGPSGAGTLDITIGPAQTGPNAIGITVHGPTGTTNDVAELDVELALPQRHLGPLSLPVSRPEPGRYRADGQIPFAGTWELALTVRTSDIDETTVRLPVTIN